MIKKGLLLLCLLGSTLLSMAQLNAEQEKIKEEAVKYTDLLEAKDMRSAMEFVYPKLFDIYPKEKMIEMMESAFNNPEMSMSYSNTEVGKVSDIVENNGARLAVVNYGFVLNMKFNQLSEEDKQETLTLTAQMLEAQNGEGSVKVNETENSLEVNNKKAMYAIYNPEVAEWKFLEKKVAVKTFIADLFTEAQINSLD